MKEKEKRSREETKMVKEVLVCNATSIWRNPDDTTPEKFIYVSDGKEGFRTQSSLKEVAEYLVKGIFLSESIFEGNKEPKIIYEASFKSSLHCSDGYFGRPPVPSELVVFKPLGSNQIKKLETHLAKLRRENGNNNK